MIYPELINLPVDNIHINQKFKDMYIIFFAIGFTVIISIYNIFLRKGEFRNELNIVRTEKILLNKKNDVVDDKLIVYLNQIIKDDKITIVKKYYYLYFILISLFSFDLVSQNFHGSWISDESNYYLTIDTLYNEFKSYKLLPYEDKDGLISCDRVKSPGIEKFIKKEDNIIVTNYWIDEQEYYVKVSYTLINDENIKAEFNGKLKGEFYYKVLNYKKVDLKKLSNIR